jgi:hypothetical protein
MAAHGADATVPRDQHGGHYGKARIPDRVSAETPERLAEEVELLLADGYKLQGSLFVQEGVSGPQWIQGVIRESKPEPRRIERRPSKSVYY